MSTFTAIPYFEFVNTYRNVDAGDYLWMDYEKAYEDHQLMGFVDEMCRAFSRQIPLKITSVRIIHDDEINISVQNVVGGAWWYNYNNLNYMYVVLDYKPPRGRT